MPEHNSIIVKSLTAKETKHHLNDLSGILSACVNQGAAVSFIIPFSQEDAQAFWQEDILPTVEKQERSLWAAFKDDKIVGTVQLIKTMPPNQPDRSEVAKLLVHPEARRQGVARRLMQALEKDAKDAGKKLITLDTKTGDRAERLYGSLGFKTAGIIPNFALDADQNAYHATTYMYKELA